MATRPLDKALLKEAIAAMYAAGGNQVRAAAALGLSRSSLQGRLAQAELAGLKVPRAKAPKAKSAEAVAAAVEASEKAVFEDKILELRDTIGDLKARLGVAQRETLDDRYVKEKIIGLLDGAALLKTPTWSLRQHAPGKSIGIPMTVWSDWHFGEVVFPSQVNGVNEYNLQIARERVRRLVDRTIDLLTNHMVNPNYPGILVALIGDLVSGGIHDELAATDDQSIMPIVLEVFGALVWALEKLADKFGKVWLVGLSGNHGRNTKKIWAKNRNYTNFDWLICKFLAKHFERDKRIEFMVPDGMDARVEVFGHAYLFTHGDRLGRGGDGIIGSAGPIIRGTIRKQARDSQVNQDFATLVHGHFHQYSPGFRIVGNGSLIGYSEYAYTEGFGYEVPQQALWIHHPTRGLTFHMGVQVDDHDAAPKGKYGAAPVQFGRMA